MAKIKHRYDGLDVYDVASDVRVKYRDYFTVSHFYKLMHEWLVAEGWGSASDSDWEETLYLQRESQKNGKEYWVWWRFQKKPDGSKYFRMDFDVDIHINMVKDHEVMHDGQKYKTNWGEPEVKLYAKLVMDPDNELQNHKLWGGFYKTLMGRVLYKQKDYYRKLLHRDVTRFIDLLKNYFQFKTYLPEKERHHLYPDARLQDK